MMIGVIELLVLLLVLAVPLFLVGRLFFGGGGGPSEERKSNRGHFSLGHATLICPHCKQETTAGNPQCESCGEDL